MAHDQQSIDQLLLVVWRAPEIAVSDFSATLVDFAEARTGTETRLAQCNFADQAVQAAASLRQRTLVPSPDALVRVVGADTVIDPAAAYPDLEAVITALPAVAKVHGYAVRSREPLTDSSATAGPPGKRSAGWSQIALLRRAPGMDTGAFRARWLDHHTQVAMEIQSTFRYVQHLVESPLSDGAPALDGIVEECFPTEAMTDLHVFFATGGDPELLAARITTMVDSVGSFLDLDNLDVIPTSEYRFD